MLFLLNLFNNLNLCTSYIKQIMNVFSFAQWNKYFHSVKDEMYHSALPHWMEHFIFHRVKIFVPLHEWEHIICIPFITIHLSESNRWKLWGYSLSMRKCNPTKYALADLDACIMLIIRAHMLHLYCAFVHTLFYINSWCKEAHQVGAD